MNLSTMYLPSQLPDIGAPMDPIAEERSGEDTTSNEGSEHNPAEHHDSIDNIKLQRVTGVSLRHTKAPPASVLKEGWMVHYTNKCTVVCKSASWHIPKIGLIPGLLWRPDSEPGTRCFCI